MRESPGPNGVDHQQAPNIGGRLLWIEDDLGAYRVAGRDFDGRVKVHAAGRNEVHLLRLCDGTRTIPTLAREHGCSVEQAGEILTAWREYFPQAFAWSELADDESTARQRANARQMLRELQAVDRRLGDNGNNHDYHVHHISDPLVQFERVETTVSHAYGAPHPALQGRSYGESFFDKVCAIGLMTRPSSILEIGCGTGRFARAFLDRFAGRLPEIYGGSTYTMFDLSPVLAQSQHEQCIPHEARIRLVSGDIEHAGPGGAFDLVIVNEVIADLSVEIVNLADVQEGRPEFQYINSYGISLENALHRFVVNRGAIRLIEGMPSLLRPRGAALISEYGSMTEFPHSVRLGDHVEHSIHFGHLVAVASTLDLVPEVEPLTTFLGFNPNCEIVSRDSLGLLLHASDELLGVPLVARTYDRQELHEAIGPSYVRLGNVRFAPVRSLDSFMSPEAFFVLKLQRR